MDIQEILNLPMDPDNNDAEATSVRDYLKRLLKTLWYQGEGFSGKRPFGNSGWEIELYIVLVKAGVIEGEVDEFGDVEEYDSAHADKLIDQCIDEVFK